ILLKIDQCEEGITDADRLQVVEIFSTPPFNQFQTVRFGIVQTPFNQKLLCNLTHHGCYHVYVVGCERNFKRLLLDFTRSSELLLAIKGNPQNYQDTDP